MRPERYDCLHVYCLCVSYKVDIRVDGSSVDIVEDFQSFTASMVAIYRVREVRCGAHLSEDVSSVVCAVDMPLSVANFTLAAAITAPPHLVDCMRVLRLFLRREEAERSRRLETDDDPALMHKPADPHQCRIREGTRTRKRQGSVMEALGRVKI